MKKDKIYSFSDEAKAIMKRFPRRETDSIEKQDYEQAMQQLVQMQEQVRSEMGLNNQQQEYKCGGNMKYADGSFLQPLSANVLPFLDTSTLEPMDMLSEDEIIKLTQQSNQSQPFGYKASNAIRNIGQNENLPYIASGLSNVAGNLLLANMAKRNKSTYAPVTATPERINMEPYAEQLRKDAGVTKNVAMRNARNLGLNTGATLANMGAIGSDVDRNLANTLTNLYGQQEQANVGTANQFNLANANAINQGRMFNTQADLANKEAQLGYLSGALGTLPGVMKDIRMDKADKEMRGILDKYYTNMGGNYKNKGKSIWDDEAFQYMVANLPNDVRDKLLRKYSKEIED